MVQRLEVWEAEWCERYQDKVPRRVTYKFCAFVPVRESGGGGSRVSTGPQVST